MHKRRFMEAQEFAKKFKRKGDVFPDITGARQPNKKIRRINVDIPLWIVDALDQEAGRLGVTRQSVIKVWLAERIGRSA